MNIKQCIFCFDEALFVTKMLCMFNIRLGEYFLEHDMKTAGKVNYFNSRPRLFQYSSLKPCVFLWF